MCGESLPPVAAPGFPPTSFRFILRGMLDGLLVLLLFHFLGELLVHYTGAPLPGPVAGMILLLGALLFRQAWLERVAPVADFLLRHLTLLFLPIALGIVLQWERYSEHGTALLAAVVAGTLLTLPLVALLMQWLLRGRKE